MFSKIIQFISEAKAELMKVDWPTKKQVRNYTLLIMAIGLCMALFLGGLDYLFDMILKSFVM